MKDKKEMPKTEEEWKKKLTPEQFRVLRQKGTEIPFTGKYHNTKEKGNYVCAGCGEELFESDTKFDSYCGWPSFYAPKDSKKIDEKEDIGFGMIRTEVLCKKCGGHLGHVFNNGLNSTGLRYCINSTSLDFKKSNSEK